MQIGENMKVQAINTYTPSANNKIARNSHVSHVSFGFGDDYGNEEFLYDSDHKSGGNIFEYIGLAIAFPFAWIHEVIKEKRAAKKAREGKSLNDSENFDINEFS